MASSNSSNGVSLYDIKIEPFRIANMDCTPVAVTVSYAVNKFVSCRLDSLSREATPPAEEAPVSATTDKVFTVMGERQQWLFTERMGNDTTFVLTTTKTDGPASEQGATVKFSGMSTNSSYSFSTTNVMMSDQALDDFALLDAMDLSVYNVPKAHRTGLGYRSVTLEKCDYNLARMIKKMVNVIMYNTDATGTPPIEVEDNDQKYDVVSRKRQHEINERVLPILNRLLDNSEDTIGWSDVFRRVTPPSRLDASLRQVLLNNLLKRSGSFISNILTLANEFKCILVPDENDGDLKYRLVNTIEVIEAEPDKLKLPSTGVSIGIGNDGGLFPCRYVAVLRSNGTPHRTSPNASDKMVAMYPDENVVAGGTPMSDPGPSWLPPYCSIIDGLPEDGEQLAEKKTSEYLYKKTVQSEDKNLKEYYAGVGAVCREWAKSTYYWNSLAASSCSVSLPLVRNMTVGKRYEVYNSEDKLLFTGFCAAVTYSAQAGGNPSATVNINFTHVEMAGFTLPR